MKWLITGGAGFIGSHAAWRLLRSGHEVVVIDNLSRRGTQSNLEWLKSQGLKSWYLTDIRAAAELEEIFRAHRDADAVLHLAAQVAVTTSVQDPRSDFEINALGTFNVLEAVRRVLSNRPVVLYSSTNKVYGGLEHIPVQSTPSRYIFPEHPNGVDEREPLDFHSPYGCSKGAGDQYVIDYGRIYGLRSVVLRQSCIYGTRQFGVEDQGWIAWFTIAALTSRPITIFGDGKQVRDALWIDDLIDLYMLIYENIDKARGQAFNVGGGPANTLSLLETLAHLEKLLGKPLKKSFDEFRPGDQRVFITDIAKVRSVLGWQPKVGVEEGIQKLWAWAKENLELLR